MSRTDGQPVFLENGGNTAFLDKAIGTLSTMVVASLSHFRDLIERGDRQGTQVNAP